jgi:secreted PhoX family phosphatase
MNQPEDARGNPGGGRTFADIAAEAISRRTFVKAGLGATAAGFLVPRLVAAEASEGEPAALLRFHSVPVSTEDALCVPPGYRAQILYRWGDPIDGQSPVFKPDASNTAAEQKLQAGMGHDGIQFFPLPRGSSSSDRGLLVLNHEYADQGLLFPDGLAGAMTAEKVAKSQAAHGVSVIEIERSADGQWRAVPSRFARRITAATPMRIAGPAAGRLANGKPLGAHARGTVNNCASGRTLWHTYLTCEENFNGVFGSAVAEFAPTAEQRRYGLAKGGFVGTLAGTKVSVYRWWEHDERFDLAKHPEEAERFGYVVEIDPFNPESVPVKRTALGRFKHENAAVTLAGDGRVVVYMGDDERNEYLYKFVSRAGYDPADPRSGHDLLDDGTLYVARFEADQRGRWIALVHGENGLTEENGFASQADVCVKTRQAGDRVGATMMDRPEWVAVHPKTGDVFVTLSNNDRRGSEPASVNQPDGGTAAGTARPPVDPPTRRPANVWGHIIRWREEDDPAADVFTWDVFLLAGDPALASAERPVDLKGDAFGSPDGLWIDERGILWIQTDASVKAQATPEYAGLGNNQMLAADPATGEVRRFLTGPRNCEVTGVAMTPDGRSMFVNIQHPGEPETDVSDPQRPALISNWPDCESGGRPRSATVVVTREDGGPIGA